MDSICRIVNEVVCSRFGVTEGDLYGRNTTDLASMARGFAWLMLRDSYGWTGSRLAREYGRDRRTVRYSTSKHRLYCRTQAGYGSVYMELASQVEELIAEKEKS